MEDYGSAQSSDEKRRRLAESQVIIDALVNSDDFSLDLANIALYQGVLLPLKSNPQFELAMARLLNEAV